MRRNQQGIALITVLLVMSLALLVTAGMLRSHRLALHSSAQQIHQLQLRKLAFAGETWALEHLKTQLRDPAASVASGQVWANAQPQLKIENGLIEVEIEDLAARFNLTALLTKGPVDKVLAQRWGRLQKGLKLSEVEASALQGLNLSDISQLRQVPGIDGPWLTTLQPWVVLLPKEAALNINTASATVLATLEGVTPPVANQLVAERPLQGYASVQDFTFAPTLIGLGVKATGLGTTSRWFRITTHVRMGQSRLRLESDVARDLKTHKWHLLQRRLLAPKHSESLDE
ncbi:type II secretion system protein GspK [Pseudomonas helleri]|uniref:Type II secretion system protein K n=1 Tax=Pseudomonas helleri TaxID=1608996 RepID=A0A6A7YYH9_9PSED|nr:type II secretion system protein GspK [Pseudomonas helleri]MQT28236.1 general secretion pathway protein GspK [Pseudomonas helleri]MQT80329.1 general secretion pathway protein GspK [Pseudomonas helleri]MQU16605.1 general secretion pathway protein GspK [Pseudomonas helleri]MQU26147.1 general secretion pathway protein GspK [Pseudomonas helleri]